jgi:hypothetical protein
MQKQGGGDKSHKMKILLSPQPHRHRPVFQALFRSSLLIHKALGTSFSTNALNALLLLFFIHHPSPTA